MSALHEASRGPRVRPAPARYRQVKTHVLAEIADGRLRPGDRVPSEHELVARLGVSRMTANRALRELAGEGHVVRRAGRGTFVADEKTRSRVLEVGDIAAEIRSRGHVHGTRVLCLEQLCADSGLAARLQIAPGGLVFHSVIVHLEDGVPIQLEDRHVNAALAPGYLAADFARVTASEIPGAAMPLQRLEHVIRAQAGDARTRALLEMERNEPCLVIERRTWSEDRPVSVATLYHPASRYELTGRMQHGPGSTREP